MIDKCNYPRISLSSIDTAEGAAAIASAFDAVGCFVVEGESAGTSIACGLDSWHRFKALPHETKMAHHHSVTRNGAKGGWLPMREAPVYMSHMDEQELSAQEFKQQFGCGLDVSATLWPNENECPGFATGVQQCLTWIDDVSKRLLAGFERVLGQSPGFFSYQPGYLTFSAYPGQLDKQGSEQESFGLHEHSDATVFTLLTQREQALQIKLVDGTWSSVPVLLGDDLLVLPGDWMELWTNGTVRAVRHRVYDTTYDRYSLAFFQSVSRMHIGPLEAFVSVDNPVSYPTVDSDIPYAGGKSGAPRWKTTRPN